MYKKYESDNTNITIAMMEYVNYGQLQKVLNNMSGFSSKWGLSQGDRLMPQPDTDPVDTFTQ